MLTRHGDRSAVFHDEGQQVRMTLEERRVNGDSASAVGPEGKYRYRPSARSQLRHRRGDARQRVIDPGPWRNASSSPAYVQRSPVALGGELLRTSLVTPGIPLEPVLFPYAPQPRLERGQLLQRGKLLGGKRIEVGGHGSPPSLASWET